MKDNPTDRMKDPFYSGLLFKIEQMICVADDEAKSQGLELTDSQVRSAIVKARKKMEGENPNIPEATERDRILAVLIDGLFQAPDDILEKIPWGDGIVDEEPLRLSVWIKALETVEDSVKTHKSNIPGSRDYLNFIHRFIQQAEDAE